MFIFKRVHHVRQWIDHQREKGLIIGFVPTMGALHQGHLSLVTESRASSDLTVVSIFVNPRQFNDSEDLRQYPKPIESDLRLLYESGIDMVFLPDVDDIYPPGDIHRIAFDPGPSALIMEGHFRPGHFEGMAEVVHRLLDIITPDQLFMGQKDFQQFAIIRKLIRDLHLPVRLIMCPTIREENGLAMSSRNARLSPEARREAGRIYTTLRESLEAMVQGMDIRQVRETAMEALRQGYFDPDYVEIVDGQSLEPLLHIDQAEEIIVCCAVKIEGVRLIDNMILSKANDSNV